MIQIAIYGTKSGYTTFTQTEKGDVIPLDLRVNVSKDITAPAIGSQLYAIDIKDNYHIYSKIKVVKDIERSKATGFVAFSVAIERNKRISGRKIVEILDELSYRYCDNYNIQNDINVYSEEESFNTKLFNDIKTKYEQHVLTNEFIFTNTVNNHDAPRGYLYYNSSEELINLFDDPHFEEISKYLIVFLVDKTFVNQINNPLLAFKTDSSIDLTNKIDTRNTRYKIQFSSKTTQGASVILKVNNERKESGAIIRKNDLLEFSFEKDNYQSKSRNGNLAELGAEFLEVDELSRVVTIKNITLDPEKTKVRFEVVDEDNKKIDGATLWLLSENGSEKQVNVEEEFSADDIAEKFTIRAAVLEDIYSDKKDFIPIGNSIVSLKVKPHKTIRFVVYDATTNEEIKNATVSIVGKGHARNNTIQFVGKDQIQQEWQATFSAGEGYEEGKKSFKPLENDTVKLEIKKRDKYFIDPGEFGTYNRTAYNYTFNKNENDYKKYIKPKRGYEFERFDLKENESKEYAGTLKAIYKKKRFSPKLISILVLLFLLISATGLGGYRLYFGHWPSKKSVTKIWEGITFWNGTDNEICEEVQEKTGQEGTGEDSKDEQGDQVDDEGSSVSSDQGATSVINGADNQVEGTHSQGTDPEHSTDLKSEAGTGINNPFQTFIKGDFNYGQIVTYSIDNLNQEEKKAVEIAKKFWTLWFNEQNSWVDFSNYFENDLDKNDLLKNSKLANLVQEIKKSQKDVPNVSIKDKKNWPLSEIKKNLNENN